MCACVHVCMCACVHVCVCVVLVLTAAHGQYGLRGCAHARETNKLVLVWVFKKEDACCHLHRRLCHIQQPSLPLPLPALEAYSHTAV